MAKKLINGKKYDVVPNTDLGTNVLGGGAEPSGEYIEAPANPSDGDTLVYNAELQKWEAKAPESGVNIAEAVFGEPFYDEGEGRGYVPLYVNVADVTSNTFAVHFPENAPELTTGWAYVSEYTYNNTTISIQQYLLGGFILLADEIFLEYIPELGGYATTFAIRYTVG